MDTFKKNVGWLCLEPYAFQKKLQKSVLGAPIFFELRFIIKENNFLTRVEGHALVNRVIKKVHKEKVYNEFFSRDIIERMTIPTEKNWTTCLID